jgi:hypothetical protein
MPAPLPERLRQAARLLLTGSLPRPQPRPVPAITPEEVAEARSFFPAEKFFIFGHARSGTTLLARLTRLHPQVHCNYQAHFFTRQPLLESLVADSEVGGWLARRSNRWNQGRDLSPLVLRAAADFILEREARREGKPVVGDKSPNSLLDGQAVHLMYKVYPDARLVFIVRDGRDAVVSHRFQAFIDSPQHLSAEDVRLREAFAGDPGPFMDGRRSIFTPGGLHTAAQEWVKNVQETDREGRAVYGGRYLSLRYEDLLADPLAEMKRLWAFLGVAVDDPALAQVLAAEMQRNPDADWQHQKAGALIAPLEKGKQGSWRELFTARDRADFKAVAGQTLVDWGYEKDLEW